MKTVQRALALAGIRVLVVDDEPDARDLLNHALRSYGAEVWVAASARAGLDALQQWRPDVVVADIGMPSEDGYELIREMRALPPERGGLTPAAAVTAYGGADNRVRALSAGYPQHIAKPGTPQELARIVSHLADGARSL